MAIQVRKKENKNEQIEVKEAEVVEAGTPVDVKLPPMTDKFLMTSGSLMAWIMEHRRMIIFFVALTVIVCLSIIGAMQLNEKSKVDLSANLSTVFVTLHAPTEAEAQAENEKAKAAYEQKGISADTNDYLRYEYTVPSDEERFKALKAHLSSSIGAFDGTELSPAAHLLLAGIATHDGDMDTAKNAFDKVRAGSQDLRLFALLGEAENLTQNKQYKEAIDKYDEIDRLAAGYGSYVKLAQGNLYETMGDTAHAIEAYTSVIRDFNYETDHTIALTRLRLLTPDWKTLTLPPQPSAPSAALPANTPDATVQAEPAASAPAAPVAP